MVRVSPRCGADEMNTNNSPSLAYRPDIDGLRAFAVLAVVAYHAFPDALKGGFIGVDIFFVISGYLICGVILNDLQQGTFSLWNFYSRRIRRIFPALIVVLATTLIFGGFTLFPDEYRTLGKHVFGGAAFISNFLLWQEAGYFDVAAKAKPLLHLWSLGIEEQFYIVFPLLLWCCAKKHFRMATVIIILGIVSFLDNLYCMPHPTANFYNPLARAWELLAGAVLCTAMRQASTRELYLKLDTLAGKILCVKEQENDGRSVSPVFALLGATMLGCALWLVRDSKPYPGWQAILPVLGTVFLIAAGPFNPISKHLLANRFAVFIGLVSYPFYLWHWTLISFVFIINGGLDSSTRLLRVGLVAASFGLAVLTYVLVEKPIRFGTWARTGKIYALIVCMVTVGVAGFAVRLLDGLPERGIIGPTYFYSEFDNGIQYLHYTDFTGSLNQPLKERVYEFSDEACLADIGISHPEIKRSLFCRSSNGHGQATVALIGTSLAWSAYYGVEKFNSSVGLNTLLLAQGYSRPILVGAEALIENNDELKNFNRALLLRSFEILNRNEIKYVFIILSNSKYKNYLQPTIDKLAEAGKKVFLLVDWPTLPRRGVDYVAHPYHRQELDRSLLMEAQHLQETLQGLRTLKNVTLIESTWDAFCPGATCLTFSETGELLYYDMYHLTNAGSEFLTKKVLAPYLEKLAHRK